MFLQHFKTLVRNKHSIFLFLFIYCRKSYRQGTLNRTNKQVQAIEQNKQKLHGGQQLNTVLNFYISPTWLRIKMKFNISLQWFHNYC